jgi:DNA processing protein
MDYEEIQYQIALLEVEGIGVNIARQLLDHFGSAKEIFNQPNNVLHSLKTVGPQLISAKSDKGLFMDAEKEITYCDRNSIQVLSVSNENYPRRLKQCSDAPIILYYKGNGVLNNPKVISIVGTRAATSYGKEICSSIVKELSAHNALIVSGLAFGIDVQAHNSSLNNNLPTIGVLAHGLDRMYPREHTYIANKMIEAGGILTENRIGTRPERENFPKRNRIVAGLSDATIVIESAIRGGSMITANIANNYNRDVFAIPGRIGNKQSEGCNHLIKINKAHLLQSVKDITYLLGWDLKTKKPKPIQKQIFIDLNPEEKCIMAVLLNETNMSIDEIAIKANLPMSIVSTQLLLLEFKGVIKKFPGKKYEVV